MKTFLFRVCLSREGEFENICVSGFLRSHRHTQGDIHMIHIVLVYVHTHSMRGCIQQDDTAER